MTVGIDGQASVHAQRTAALEPPRVEPQRPTPAEVRAERVNVDPQRQSGARNLAAGREQGARVWMAAQVGAAGAGPQAGVTVTRAVQSATPLLDRIIERQMSPTLEAVIAETERRMAAGTAARATAGRAIGVVGRLASGVGAAIAVMTPAPLNGNEDRLLRAARADRERLKGLGLTPGGADHLMRSRDLIQHAAAGLQRDPTRLAQELDELRAQNPNLRIEHGDPLNVGSNELDAMRARAAELQQGGMSAEEAMRTAAGELHSRLAAQSDRTLGRPVMYDYDRATGAARVPSELQIRYGAPNPNDPAERALMEAHNRAVLEEVTHAAGFAAQPGAYTPMSARAQVFGDFMQTDEGRAWARARGFTDDEIATFGPKLHEADVVDVMRDRSPFSQAEIDRYPVRRAFERFVTELEAEVRSRRR